MHEVVLSGIGVIGPHGVGVQPLIESVAHHAPSFYPWPEAQEPPHPAAKIANILAFPKTQFFTERQLRLMDRAMTISSTAAGLALEDAGFIDGAVPTDTATFLGT
jgi:3-oxoacyl-(acyl-carrier-protein) synthase